MFVISRMGVIIDAALVVMVVAEVVVEVVLVELVDVEVVLVEALVTAAVVVVAVVARVTAAVVAATRPPLVVSTRQPPVFAVRDVASADPRVALMQTEEITITNSCACHTCYDPVGTHLASLILVLARCHQYVASPACAPWLLAC